MGSRSPGTQTVVNRTEPDPITSQWRNTIGSAAQNLYNQGAAPYYPGQTVVPFSQQTQAGLDMMQGQAMMGAPLQAQAYDAAGRMMSGFTPGMGVAMDAAYGGLDAETGFNPYTDDVRSAGMSDLGGAFANAYGGFGGANPFTQGIAGAGAQGVANQVAGGFAQQQAGANPFLGDVRGAGQTNLAGQIGAAALGAGQANPFAGDVRASGMTNIASQIAPSAMQAGGFNPFMAASAQAGAQQTQMGVDALQGVAGGGASNPFLDRLFDRGANQLRNQVDAAFARSGMTGTAAHQGEFQDGLSGLFSQIYAPAYEQERNRQMAAAGQLAGIDQANRSAALQGFGQAGGFFDGAQGRGLQGLGLAADVMGQDASRNMQAAQAAAQLSEAAQGRGLQGLGMFLGAAEGDASRNMQAAQAAGGLFENAQGRGLNALNAFSDLLSNDAQRNLAAQQAAGALFENAQGRGLGALSSLAALYGADADRNFAGAQSAAQLSQADMARLLQAQGLNASNRLAGAGLSADMFNNANQNALRGIAALPSIYDYGMQPARTMMGVGGAYEDMANQYLADDMARYNYANNAQWQNLARFSDMVSGLPSYDAQMQTSPLQRTNPLMGALGGASAGAGILGAMGGMGGSMAALAAGPAAPFVLAGSALLGLLGSR